MNKKFWKDLATFTIAVIVGYTLLAICTLPAGTKTDGASYVPASDSRTYHE